MKISLFLCVVFTFMCVMTGVGRDSASAQGLIAEMDAVKRLNAALKARNIALERRLDQLNDTLEHRLNQLENASQAASPSGAVMAFNLAECPEGWTPFAPLQGRVAVGAGQGEGLTDRALADAGGKEQVALASRNMPSHSHRYKDFFYLQESGSGRDNGFSTQSLRSGHSSHTGASGGDGNNVGWYQWRSTDSSGAGRAHENMPPFHVLTYCEKQ